MNDKAESSRAFIERMNVEIDRSLGAALRDSKSYAILDFPEHANIGDSAIWLGEWAYLHDRYGTGPAYACWAETYSADRLARALPDGAILLHGGGNFGDLWQNHQLLREAVFEQFRERQIVQLPQTIHFGDSRALEKTAALIRRLNDFTLLVRDEKSRALAQSAFDCTVKLCPDSAFKMKGFDRPGEPREDLLLLLRTDKESDGAAFARLQASPAQAMVADWPVEPSLPGARRLSRLAQHAADRFGLVELSTRRLTGRAARRVNRGRALLASARYVITDRLHAHILCVMLGIPHSVLDNVYGKIAGFIDTWHPPEEIVSTARSLDEALTQYALFQQRRAQ